MALVNPKTKKTNLLLDSRNTPRCVTSFCGAHLRNITPGNTTTKCCRGGKPLATTVRDLVGPGIEPRPPAPEANAFIVKLL